MVLDLSDSITGAKSLLGYRIINYSKLGMLSGYIVETESYGQADEASHSFKGITARNQPMFEEAGTIYIYFIYGLHYCFNIVTGHKGSGQAVLIRALQPIDSIENMRRVMCQNDETKIANGPAKLFRAMGFNKNLNGLNIYNPTCPIKLIPGFKPANIEQSSRIGINKNIEPKHRFFIKGNPYVSKK